ncbi:LacI family DNA-binding transcriptional regulator [Agromyces aerolatus]|uniref:LacI family DNA-binding transcriptional regulator n=1 Tax=Agromyces sp. LY-1074 TaxID=3074080 RepID=UPI00285FFE7B|nr:MULTISPECIES: LacI family DNA-binding transcriptional regulator [unclassified Agromyces]MDR5699070.1 LacI family DNA-binding transcriptional regulator [Agromyces sp. LY-1074]MDR5705152.1 LacI family DNA-binding transcriptional regulator [Agromyces sp. LY-1358]
MNESPQRPTLEDVARHAGVSRALASIVLREAPGASAESRARVRASMRALGYRPDRRASRLAAARTRVIGVQFALESEFHARLLRGLYAAATRSGYELLLSGVTYDRQPSEAIATLQEARPDGLILIDPGEIGESVGDDPLVLIGHTGPEHADRVLSSSSVGVRLALDHLTRLGHTAICHVALPGHPVGRRRLEAYRSYVEAHGLAEHVLDVTSGNVGAGAAVARRLLGGGLPTAVLAYNDEVAVGVITELTRCGILVPQEVSVLGFDDVGWASSGLRLTTVSQHIEQLAARAIETLVGRIEQPELRHAGPTRLVIEPSLRVRDSTAPPRTGE